jgi:hypothetical protein
MLLKPTENRTSSEKAVFTMNNIATSHGAQPLLAKRLNAVIKLKIPRNPKCGG